MDPARFIPAAFETMNGLQNNLVRNKSSQAWLDRLLRRVGFISEKGEAPDVWSL
jgi:hypothetical protein